MLGRLGGVARLGGVSSPGGRGLRTCRGGTKLWALDPRGHRRESGIPARGGVAAQAGKRRDAAGEWGHETSAAQLLASPHGVPCVRGQLRAGYPRARGKAGVSLRAAGAVGGAGPGSPGARRRKETRLSGGLELGRAGTEHFRQVVKRVCARFASELRGRHDSGSRQVVF